MADRRITPRTMVLAAVTVAAAVVLVAIWPRGTADTTGNSPQGRPGQGTTQAADPAVPLALGLERIEAGRPAPAVRRDLFRFGAATPDPASAGDPEGQSPQRPTGGRRGASAPAQPVLELPVAPPPPPIPLRVVAIARTANGEAVAGLSDGKNVFQGKVGEVIEGRWRIVSIGVESVVIERVDGTGRQTLRGPG